MGGGKRCSRRGMRVSSRARLAVCALGLGVEGVGEGLVW
jgi:hypothetical protein